MLGNGGGGGYDLDMKVDVAVLKHRADATEQRLGRMEAKLDTLIERTARMPTIAGMWGMIATVIGICAASVGVIVAVLAWLQAFHK